MPVSTSGTFPTHAELRAWMEAELGQVPVETLLAHSPPASLGALGELSDEEANERVRQTFLKTFMSEEDYARQIEFLAELTPRETRMKIAAPLPMTDFCVMLQRPESGADALDRAAALSFAATQLHLQFIAGDLSTTLSRAAQKVNCVIYDNAFGLCLVPGAGTHSVTISKHSTYCVVMAKGAGYRVELIESGVAIGPARLRHVFADIVASESPRGELGLLRCVPLGLAHHLGQELRADTLELLHGALFTVCLDEPVAGESSPPGLDEVAVSLFTGSATNRANRWYGRTQLVVRPDAEAAVVFSFMCGMEGVQGNEIADELHKRARELERSRPWAPEGGPRSGTPAALELGASEAVATQLRAHSGVAFHGCQAVFTLPFGLKQLKALGVSPNVGIQCLLMLGFMDTAEVPYLPETSQAVMVRPDRWGGVQLDWLRARPEGLRRFLAEPDDLDLFRAAVEDQKQLIFAVRESLSPFLFFDNPLRERDRPLVDFYLSLGHEEPVGAYRHYLCASTRDSKALDLVTSSIVLWDSIEILGRPGARSGLTSMSGVHVLFGENSTRLSLIPSRAWEAKLGQAVERCLAWMRHLESLTGAAPPR